MKRFIYFTFVVLSTLALFSACSDAKEVDGKPNVTVTFDSQGGSAVAPITVEQGAKITKPTDPTKKGEIFAGWFKEQAATTAWDFQNNIVEANITLYAKWVSPDEVFTVTFETNGGSALAPVEVASGAKVTKPADPIKEGFTLENWYSNAALTTAYNFTTPVTANLTLYAKWTEAASIDRAALLALLNNTRTINPDEYTAESYAVLTAAQETAQTVLDNTNATAAEITAAYKDLQKAFDGLVSSRDNNVVGLVVKSVAMIDDIVYISPNQWISIMVYGVNAAGEPVSDEFSGATFEYDATQVAKWGTVKIGVNDIQVITGTGPLEAGATSLKIISTGNPEISQTITLKTAEEGELKQIYLDMVAALPEPAAISYNDLNAIQQANNLYYTLSTKDQEDPSVVAAQKKIEECFAAQGLLPERLKFSAFTGDNCTLSSIYASGEEELIGDFAYAANGTFPTGVFEQTNAKKDNYGFFQVQYTLNTDGTGTKKRRSVDNAAGDNPTSWEMEHKIKKTSAEGSQAEGGIIYITPSWE